MLKLTKYYIDVILAFMPSSPETDARIPRLTLQEGVDYLDLDELDALVIAELERLGIPLEEILLTGHDGSGVADHERTGTFALTAEETQHALRFGPETSTPYFYATNPGVNESTISVYSRDSFEQDRYDEIYYRLKPGLTFAAATILEVKLLYAGM